MSSDPSAGPLTNPDFCAYTQTGCAEGFASVYGSSGQRCCGTVSPLLVSMRGKGFDLTSANDGVVFDFFGNGHPIRISWTAPGSDNAWLVLDRNGNGRIDNATEMFGNLTPQPQSPAPNGFLALAEMDKPEQGGNGDGEITNKDAAFQRLRLWRDENHNATSEPGELLLLSDVDVKRIDLRYQETKWVDAEGNEFRYRGRIWGSESSTVGRFIFDVFLTTMPSAVQTKTSGLR